MDSLNPTLTEIEQSILCAQRSEDGNHRLVHIRFGPDYLDCKFDLLTAAWECLKRKISLLEMGIEDPSDHKDSALLLMMFQQMYYHGYTPKPTL